MSEPAEDSAHADNKRPTIGLALGLCLPIVVALVILNTLGEEGEEIAPEHFSELMDRDLVEEIRLQEQVLRCLLRHPIRLTEAKAKPPVRRVVLRYAARPSPADLSGWREQGIRVVVVEGGGESGTGIIWWPVAMALLLGLGTVHLLRQARRHRRHGGPRQRLQDAERQLLNGELSREQYDRLAATISSEM